MADNVTEQGEILLSVNALSAAVDEKVYIENPAASLSDYSDLSVVKLSREQYEDMVVTETLNPRAIYVVDYDVIDAYGRRIVNLANPVELSDAVNFGVLDSHFTSVLLSVNALSATAGRIADVSTSSVTELSEAPTLDDSLLLVSRPFQFGEGEGHVAYQSMKTPLSVLAKTILSSYDKGVIYIENTVNLISSSLSGAIAQSEGATVYAEVDSPYIISSMRYEHGALCSISGYALSDQITILSNSELSNGDVKRIATLDVGGVSTDIVIPDKEQVTTELKTYKLTADDSGWRLDPIPSKTVGTVLQIHAMTDEAYQLLNANTNWEGGKHEPTPINETLPSIQANELYFTVEDGGWEQDDDGFNQNATVLATEASLPEPDGDSAASPVQITIFNQDEGDDWSVGRSIDDFEEVTLIDIQPEESEPEPEPETSSEPNAEQLGEDDQEEEQEEEQ